MPRIEASKSKNGVRPLMVPCTRIGYRRHRRMRGLGRREERSGVAHVKPKRQTFDVLKPIPYFETENGCVRCFCYSPHISTFQLLDKPWSQMSSFLPPRSCLQFLSRIGLSNPTALSVFHRVLLTHALALSASQFCAQEKVPSNALGGARTHETHLYQARG